MNPTLEQIRNQVAVFSLKTFGTRPYTAPLHHLKKEVDEAIASGELSEYADCLLLLLDSFNSKYPNLHTDDLLRASETKLDYVDKNYKWGAPDEHGDCQHIVEKPVLNCIHVYDVVLADGTKQKCCDVELNSEYWGKGKAKPIPCCFPNCGMIEQNLPCNHRECILPHERAAGNCHDGKCVFNIKIGEPK